MNSECKQNKIKVLNHTSQEDRYLSLLYGIMYRTSGKLICHQYTDKQLYKWLKYNSHNLCLHSIYLYPQKETILFLHSRSNNNFHGIFTSKEQLERINVSSYPDIYVYVIFSNDTFEILRYWVNSELKISVARLKASFDNDIDEETVCWSDNISSFYELDDLDKDLLDYMESTYIMKYKLIERDTTNIFNGLIYR